MCCWALFIWWANTQRTHITAKWNMHIENMNSSTARARSNPALTPFAHFRPGVYLNFSIFTNRKAIQLVGRWELRCATNYWPLCRAHRVCSSSQPTRERERYGALKCWLFYQRARYSGAPDNRAITGRICSPHMSRGKSPQRALRLNHRARVATHRGIWWEHCERPLSARECRQYNALRLYRSLARCDRYF